jgi:hypothetical protein
MRARLLYTNPVCLLSSFIPRAVRDASVVAAADAAAAAAASDDDGDKDGSGKGGGGRDGGGRKLRSMPAITWTHNVMVLSWMTPINNDGLFMFSLNKKRFSADCLAKAFANNNCSDDDDSDSGGDATTATKFMLCVPCKGMEPIVLHCGRTR